MKVYKHQKAQDQKQLRREIRTIFERLSSLTDDVAFSVEINKWLTTQAQFHHYSLGNAMLIFVQYPKATKVAGYKTWQKLRRQVKRGEQGIRILAPVVVKHSFKVEPVSDEEQVIEKVIFFKTVSVFDISQTSGEPLPETPQWFSVGEDGADLACFLKEACRVEGISVSESDELGGPKGISHGGSITLAAGLSPLTRTEVLAHELAHELLHHHQGDNLPRNICEAEAAATAFVVLAHYGLDDDSKVPNYIALWNANSILLEERFERIAGAARRIIRMVERVTFSDAV